MKTIDELVKESWTVPYYSVFQRLVICLISIPESNGIIIKNQRETESMRRGQCAHF